MDPPRPARGCFCLSKGRRAPADGAAAAALREELGALHPASLSRRAKAEGIDGDHVDNAFDSGDPRSTLIEMIVAHSEASSNAPDDAALRSELEGMRLKALKLRAVEAGVAAEAIADADDADDIKAEVIRLILEAHVPSAAAAADEARRLAA
eukprot:COSAG04_NODE_8633_length_947_cov_3.757075_2_plen_151_part_01